MNSEEKSYEDVLLYKEKKDNYQMNIQRNLNQRIRITNRRFFEKNCQRDTKN